MPQVQRPRPKNGNQHRAENPWKIVAFFFLEEKKMAGRSGTDLIRDNVDTIQQQVRFDASW